MTSRRVQKVVTFINFTIFILFIQYGTFAFSKSCNVDNLLRIGLKTFCESAEEYSISCLENSLLVKKAYIRCITGYQNDQNITEQIIHCMDNGEWNDEPIKCIADCIEIDGALEVLDGNHEEIPASYVEIMKKILNNDKIDILPGIIVSEREILAKCQYFDNEVTENLKIRTSNNKIKIKEYEVASILRISNGSLCVLSLDNADHFRFSEYLKPICNGSTLINSAKMTVEYNTNTRMHKAVQSRRNSTGTYFDKINQRLIQSDRCFVPRSTSKNIEFQCFEDMLETTTNVSISHPVECLMFAQKAIKRCHIGYQNKKLNKNRNDRLDFCSSSNWLHESEEDDDCELACDSTYNFSSRTYRLVTTTPLPSLPPSPLNFGIFTDIITAPWHVGIYANYTEVSKTGIFQQICGGTIIHSNIVISAGHCFNRMTNLSNYRVVGGKLYRSYEKYDPFSDDVGIKELHIPSFYESSPVRYDIAVLVLDRHLQYTKHIKPACIEWKSYKNYDVEKEIIGRVVGWGSTSKDDISSTKLYEINFETEENQRCKQLVNTNFQLEITHDRFCAKSDNTSAACRGDSGGGFIIKKKIQNKFFYFLIGIVSVALDEETYCSENSYTAFTNIQYYQDFIKSIISETRNAFINN